MTPSLLTVFGLTLQVAVVATLGCAVPCIVLGYALARRDFFGKHAIVAWVSVPLVVPPTAVGGLLLRLFAADGPLGRQALGFDLDLVLTWKGAAVASALMSTPLIVRTAQVAFEGVDSRLEAMARTLGYSPTAVFLRFTLPMAQRGVLAALILGFARALGEYGATVTLAGSIPGATQTLASAITSADQAGDLGQGRLLIVCALTLGLGAVYAAERLTRAAPVRARP